MPLSKLHGLIHRNPISIRISDIRVLIASGTQQGFFEDRDPLGAEVLQNRMNIIGLQANLKWAVWL
jgi:hypothetical protein